MASADVPCELLANLSLESANLSLESGNLSLGPANRHVFLLRLPPEILADVRALLPNSDIKNLRQTCSEICEAVPLRLSRVFLSPNPRNVRVFRAVADHDRFRRAVREIIYDDARLKTHWLTNYLKEETNGAQETLPQLTPLERHQVRVHAQYAKRTKNVPTTLQEKREHAERGATHWFRITSIQNNKELDTRRGNDDPRLPQHAARAVQRDAQRKWEKCWPLYAALAQQQLDVMEKGADEKALAYGLSRFPNVERVIITPATHGFPYVPLYQTPMIRALPVGFNYPIPRGWPFVKRRSMADTSPWVPGPDMMPTQVTSIKSCWRGLLLVLKQLAEEIEIQGELVVPELVMDVRGLNTGLNPHMFEQPSAEYDHLVTILSQPGFRRLDLPLMLGNLAAERWSCLTSGYFRGLLAKARDLTRFRLAGDADDYRSPTRVRLPPGGGSTRHCPLARILPVARWSTLRHFGLYRVPVQVDDLLVVLAALPEALREVELGLLRFPDKSAQYRELLEAMRTTLPWKSRQAAHRPAVCIGLRIRGDWQAGRAVWICEEVGDFLYGDGANPFLSSKSTVEYGIGVMKDDFDPDYERPHVEAAEMVRLGIHLPPEDKTISPDVESPFNAI